MKNSQTRQHAYWWIFEYCSSTMQYKGNGGAAHKWRKVKEIAGGDEILLKIQKNNSKS